MTLDSWLRVKAVVQDALERAPDARAAFVAEACHDDHELRGEVESLLAAHERAGTFLDAPPSPTELQEAVERLRASHERPRSLLEMTTAAALDDKNARPRRPSRAETPFPGTERFTVVRRLGAGGMGVVYEVHDRIRDQVVALKTLLHATAADIYRLKREFRSLADVAHTNLVSLYELVVQDEHCFFTMELVDGVNLVDYIRRSSGDAQRVCADRIRDVLRQLIEGLLALHRKGKLHRDIKPSNVLVTVEGRVVILDFGLTSDVRPEHARGLDSVAGTPAYLAPESGPGTVSSDASDWYSVGVTLYELLTGRVPFDGPPSALFRRKRESDPPPPAQIAPDVPDDLNAICMGLLCRDPERRLSGREALRQIASGAGALSALSAPPRGVSSFVGRARELDILNSAFLGATHGCAGVVCIHGPSGIGKSALVQCFLDRVLEREDVVVLRGRCYERESVPYKALDGVIDSLSQYLSGLRRSQAETLVPRDVVALARLFPVMLQAAAVATAPSLESEVPDPLVLRRRAFSALRELLARIADRQPLVLCIDDLQWADADSVLLLEELLRPPQPPPFLMLACFRREEIAFKPFLQTLLERAGSDACMALPLEPMTEDEARELIGSLMPSDSSVKRTAKITREAGGNPFLLEQLARFVALNETGPDTFAEMLKGRLGALPPGGRRFLETLAVCGRPMAPDLVYEASGLAGDERPLVALLRTERFLRSSGSAERVEIYHDRIRETLVARVSPVDERRIHGHIVQSLVARRVDDPEALYEHYRGAGDLERASTQAALAARKAAAALAFDRAALFYRGALELAPGSAARVEWREGLADALANAGRPAEAGDVFLEAASDADPTRRVELQRRAAEQMLIGGHIDRGLEVIRAVLREVDIRLPTGRRVVLASFLARRAQLRWRGLTFVAREAERIAAEDLLRIDTCWSVATGLMLVDNIRAADFHTRYLLLALDAGEPYRIARGLATEAGFSAIAGKNKQRTADLVERARTMAESVGHPAAIAGATLGAGAAAYLVGEWRKATLLCERALGILRDRCVGVTWELTAAQNFLLGSLLYEGEFPEVSRRVPILLATAREHGNLYFETEIRTRMTLVWLAADDPDEGERQANEAMERWSHAGFHRQHYNHLFARIQTELYRGNAQPAWQLIAENSTAVNRSQLLRIQWTRIEFAYARARTALLMAAAEGDARTFLSVARNDARRIAREKMPWSDPIALLLHAAVAYLEGDTSVAKDRLAVAATGFDRADMKLYAAIARRRLGVLQGDDQGRELVRRSDDWMTGQGIRNVTRMTRLLAPGFPDG